MLDLMMKESKDKMVQASESNMISWQPCPAHSLMWASRVEGILLERIEFGNLDMVLKFHFTWFGRVGFRDRLISLLLLVAV